ncbi:MAG TPA: phosphate-starvation-inducible PsiE family protein [Gammaproteobacteria bacterium]|nr:phosphate-starvation-inducible PsiE family protein [Gammaproteobacteria bacterium]
MQEKKFPLLEKVGDYLVDGFHLPGLFVIGGTIVWSAIHEYVVMMQSGHAALNDILLLFIYLELGAMVGIYFKTHRLPVSFLIYIAITALTRFLAVDVKDLGMESVVLITGAILILTLAVLALQFSGYHYIRREAGEDPPEHN